jgi:hypothetical protein
MFFLLNFSLWVARLNGDFVNCETIVALNVIAGSIRIANVIVTNTTDENSILRFNLPAFVTSIAYILKDVSWNLLLSLAL